MGAPPSVDARTGLRPDREHELRLWPFRQLGRPTTALPRLASAGLISLLAIDGDKPQYHLNAIAPIAATRMTESILGELGVRISPKQ